jgi:hypothetical protein
MAFLNCTGLRRHPTLLLELAGKVSTERLFLVLVKIGIAFPAAERPLRVGYSENGPEHERL